MRSEVGEGCSPYLVCLSPVGHGLLEDMGQGGAQPSGGRHPELSSFHSVGFPGLSLDGGGVCSTFSCFPRLLSYCLPCYYRISLEETARSAQETFACSCLRPKTFCSMTTRSAWPDSRAKTRIKNIWDQRTSRLLVI